MGLSAGSAGTYLNHIFQLRRWLVLLRVGNVVFEAFAPSIADGERARRRAREL
jgi:hypothetical protein